MKRILVWGSFDDLSVRRIRLLHEASRLGAVHLVLPEDAMLGAMLGRLPKYTESERRYFFESVRFVTGVQVFATYPGAENFFGSLGFKPDIWCVSRETYSEKDERFARHHGIEYREIPESELAGFPSDEKCYAGHAGSGTGKRVVVTGCYDWFHSGHVRFFEEASAFGDLYVVVGHDANIRLLKGEGHPLFPEEERRYSAQAIRFVREAFVSSGSGWMDAEPEITGKIHPHIYAVNEDGDKPEKREFCERLGIEYLVLKRLPKEGLPRRSSTELRGF